jgi:hypothetical protein
MVTGPGRKRNGNTGKFAIPTSAEADGGAAGGVGVGSEGGGGVSGGGEVGGGGGAVQEEGQTGEKRGEEIPSRL